MKKSENRIRKLRQEKEMSLAKMSRELKSNYDFEITPDALGKYERGLREPKSKTWQILANFFNVSVPYLQGYLGYSASEIKDTVYGLMITNDDEMHDYIYIKSLRTYFLKDRNKIYQLKNTSLEDILKNIERNGEIDLKKRDLVLNNLLSDIFPFDFFVDLGLNFSDNITNKYGNFIDDDKLVPYLLDKMDKYLKQESKKTSHNNVPKKVDLDDDVIFTYEGREIPKEDLEMIKRFMRGKE